MTFHSNFGKNLFATDPNNYFLPQGTYLDSAATTQRLKKPFLELPNYLSQGIGNPLRGASTLSQQSFDHMQEWRYNISKHFGLDTTHTLILCYNASDALNKTVQFIKQRHGTLISSIFEHHSSRLPLEFHTNQKPIIIQDIQNLSLVNKINHINLMQVTMQSNVSGETFDWEPWIQLTHAKNGLFSLDATQGLIHAEKPQWLNQCDFISASAHKMYSQGLGLLWIKNDILLTLPIINIGGGAVLSAEPLLLQNTYHRYEPGTQHLESLFLLNQTLDLIMPEHHDIIHHEQQLTMYLIKQINQNFPDIHLFNNSSNYGIISLMHPNLHPHDWGDFLNNHNIYVRVGHHCAQPFLSSLGLTALLRLSFAPYNSLSDIDHFLNITYDCFKYYKI